MYLTGLLGWEKLGLLLHQVPEHVNGRRTKELIQLIHQLNDCTVSCSDVLGLYEIRKCC